MNTPSSTSLQQPAVWTVLLGPGARMEQIEVLARAASGQAHGDLAVVLERLLDLADLLPGRDGPGRLVLDAEACPLEDLGILRRFLAACPGWEVLLVGEDASSRLVRKLQSETGASWLAWPPDIEQLGDLVRAPAALLPSAGLTPQAVSDGQRASDDAAAPAWTQQLVALSELARDCEESTRSLREDDRIEDQRLADVGRQVARLRRDARALSYLAVPPQAGATPVDLGALLEDELASLTLRDRSAARFLYRGDAGLEVRADREALTMALESVLLLARAAAGEGEVVRVQLHGPEADGGTAEIALEFPRSALSHLTAGELERPRALEGRVPELGPNDLASARAVLEAHGGRLQISDGQPGALEASILLPAWRRAPSGLLGS